MEIVIGIVLSLVMQFIKTQTNLGEYGKLAVLFGLALAASAVYTALTAYGLWEVTAHVLVTAGAFYSFIIARFKEGSELSKAMGNG